VSGEGAPSAGPAAAFEAITARGGRADPYPLYEAMRAYGNLVETKPARYVAVGYAECDAALREPRLRVHDHTAYDQVYPEWRAHSSLRAFTGSLLYRNPPDHSRLRNLLSGPFTARGVQSLRQVITEMTGELLDHVASLAVDGSAVDIIAEFAAKLPMAVITAMMGFDEGDQAWFRQMASEVAKALDGLTDATALDLADAAMDDLTAYFTGLLERRRVKPAADVVTAMGRASLSEDELLGNLMLLLTAGFETTSFLIGLGVRTALDRPEFAARLRSDQDFAVGYVEEILRYEPPVQITSRWAAADVRLAGVTIPAGSKVVILLAAGNRDPRRFHHPGSFDPDRPDNQPLSFGAGSHFCLGAPLARLEAQIALPMLLRRFPCLTAAGAPEHRDRLVVRGLDSYRVVPLPG
jgi:cytochrome P450